MKFTQSSLKKVVPPESGYMQLWDDDIPGFGARLYPNGKMTFFLSYRMNGQGKKRQFTIGRNLSIHQARQIAAQKSYEVASGVCPRAKEEEEMRKGMTFRDLIEKYREEHLLVKNSPHTIKNYKGYLIFVEAEIGSIPIADITTAQLVRIQEKAKREKGLRSSNLVVAMLKKMFSLATDTWELIDADPCKKIKKYKETPRTSFLAKAELNDLIRSIRKEENIFVSSFFLVLIHTAARRGEVANMKWKDINLEAKVWTKPTTKTGEPHVIALNQSALNILKDIPKVSNNSYVFAGRAEGRPINGFSKYWKRIKERAGITKPFDIHDLRRTIGYLLMREGDVSLEKVSQILGHNSIRTTERVYAKLGLESKQQTVDLLDDLLR